MTNPIHKVLGQSIGQLSPAVREHFSMQDGEVVYTGVMQRIWRRGGLLGFVISAGLSFGPLTKTLFRETGENIPFELQNIVQESDDGETTILWNRTFRFASVTRTFNNVTLLDSTKNVLLDRFGLGHFLEVELHPHIEDGSLTLESGKQCVRIGPIRVPLPAILTGSVRAKEWEVEEGCLRISVTLHNPIFGDLLGYEGVFKKVT